jgi:hypothetical protein
VTGWPYARRRAALLFAELGLAAPFTLCPAATDPGHRAGSEVDVLKEIFRRPGAQSLYGPVLAEEDVIGTKVRARRPTPWPKRGAPRDLIDVFAASRRWTHAELDEAFSAYGLDDSTMIALRAWATESAGDLVIRLLEEADGPGDPPAVGPRCAWPTTAGCSAVGCYGMKP